MSAQTPSDAHVQDPDTAPLDPRRWIALATLLLAAFMNLIDVSIVNVALPSMQQNLGATSSQIQWVVGGYVLAFALGLLPFGRLGDIVGRRRMFLTGVTCFTGCSLLCGVAPSIEFLMGARLLQGLAGAMMMPQVLAIVQVTFPHDERGTAFSYFGLSAGLATVAGPLIGGVLINDNLFGLDWRPIFLVNLPIGIFTVIAAWFVLRRTPPHPGLKLDLVGVGLATLTVLGFIFPLNEGRDYGWPIWIFAIMVAGAAVATLFVLWERRRQREGKPELLPYSLITNRNFVIGIFMTMTFFSALPGFFMVLALFLQQGFGFTPLQSGLATVPFPVGVLTASLLSGRLGGRILRARLIVGVVIVASAMIALRFVVLGIGDTVNPWHLTAPLVVGGFGMGTAIGALFQTILLGVPGRDAGSGSGALQAFQQIGGAFGVAIVGQAFFASLFVAAAGAKPDHPDYVHAMSNAMIYEAAAFLAVGVLVLFLHGQARVRGKDTGSEQAPKGGGEPAVEM